jgi:oligoribonuclease NrnB/cAMP/cGMP phosphodiesterase (DHH superfamily)
MIDKKNEILEQDSLKVKVFTHNDLDGVSCALVLKKLYSSKNISFNFQFIGYHQYDEIRKFFDFENGEARLYDYVFITDLNFTRQNYELYLELPLIDYFSERNAYHNKDVNNIFKKIFFIDHHKDSEQVFKNRSIPMFDCIEYYNDMMHCAAWQLAEWCIHKSSSEWVSATLGSENKDYNTNVEWVRHYTDIVNDWDTFNWKNNHNLVARDLNLLFTHIKREKFFLMQEQKVSPRFAFNKSEKTIIKETLESIEKEYKRALDSSIVLDHINQHGQIFPDQQYIVIRSDENTSLICDMIKEDILNKRIYIRYNIKYIVNVSFKYGSLNFRRIDDNINLAEIANWYGGGGHPFAAGCQINSKDNNQMQRFILPILSKYGR